LNFLKLQTGKWVQGLIVLFWSTLSFANLNLNDLSWVILVVSWNKMNMFYLATIIDLCFQKMADKFCKYIFDKLIFSILLSIPVRLVRSVLYKLTVYISFSSILFYIVIKCLYIFLYWYMSGRESYLSLPRMCSTKIARDLIFHKHSYVIKRKLSTFRTSIL
jgi:hypothetical protein